MKLVKRSLAWVLVGFLTLASGWTLAAHGGGTAFPPPYYNPIPGRVCNGGTALMAASFNGHREVVQALLAKGAQVNAQDSNGVTALILASLQGHIEVVQALLDKGADVNAKANDGGTARMVACFNGHRDVAQTLLDKGAKVNDGETALTVARDADVRALLLQAGAKS